jgi:hypothetical protein
MSEYYSVPELIANAYWKDKRFDYSGSDLIYMGVSRTENANTGHSVWNIWKLTWNGENLERFQGPLEGSWDNRAGLGW